MRFMVGERNERFCPESVSEKAHENKGTDVKFVNGRFPRRLDPLYFRMTKVVRQLFGLS